MIITLLINLKNRQNSLKISCKKRAKKTSTNIITKW